jgi:hypothetical protein
LSEELQEAQLPSVPQVRQSYRQVLHARSVLLGKYRIGQEEVQEEPAKKYPAKQELQTDRELHSTHSEGHFPATDDYLS